MEEARVLIAKDVLALLDADFFNMGGNYISFYELHATRAIEGHETQLDTLLRSAQHSCDVCALGAILVAVVLRNDRLAVGELRMNYQIVENIRRYLEPYFTKEQLMLIEDAYEGWNRTGFSGCAYLAEYSFEKVTVLRAIMANIIENNGTFCP